MHHFHFSLQENQSMLKRFILYGILLCSLCPVSLVAQTVVYKIELLQKY